MSDMGKVTKRGRVITSWSNIFFRAPGLGYRLIIRTIEISLKSPQEDYSRCNNKADLLATRQDILGVSGLREWQYMTCQGWVLGSKMAGQ